MEDKICYVCGSPMIRCPKCGKWVCSSWRVCTKKCNSSN
jgi:hypothetical protein